MNALPISVTLILVGLAVGVWHGLKWLFGWDGIGLAIAGEGEKPPEPKP